MNKQTLLSCVLMFLPLYVCAEIRTSDNFKIQADGLAPAISMGSSSFNLLSIVGDGRAVKLASSSKYKLGSSVVYAIGSAPMDQGFCFPVSLKSNKVVLICL